MVYGEKRRAVSFNLDNESERELYQLSKAMPFGQFVKRQLAAELKRRKSAESKSTITVRVGD